ncbi:MAG: 2-dehydro-3-deoxyphosphogluconate aldolase / (4S)-4-hydroxy-2-oxoglutarate aldolase [Candidatus Tokpelaia sp. JSC085]|nr:MAG: 2-dehydro-3-deoxyphosphogluconate aldolase / (4S)-4-hydroxy-2-oxoglutarate aldolase [Candidatus Tokpelaia sp. JSC085]
MSQKKELLLAIMQKQPVIPVLLIERLDDAIPLARALVRGGVKVLEVTLRTPIALECIKAIADAVPEAITGAGTVLDAGQFEDAEEAGAQFIVSPGVTDPLLQQADVSKIPFLPGAMTPCEIMTGHEKGYDIFKFFPAEQAGGIEYLKALSAPFSGVTFCPTGGINIAKAIRWLTLSNVICVGGSWLAPKEFVQTGQWDVITTLAHESSRLR